MTPKRQRQVCEEIATLAHDELLSDLLELGRKPSEEENLQYKTYTQRSWGIRSIFEAKDRAGIPLRFYLEGGLGKCPSSTMHSFDALVQSKGKDKGIDNAIDAHDETFRWARWGGGDRLLSYRGDLYIATVNIDKKNDNKISLLSWLKDGRIRPLCGMHAHYPEGSKSVVYAAQPQLCRAVLDKSIAPMTWKKAPVTKNWNEDEHKQRRDRFIRHVNASKLVRLDVDNDGKEETVARLEYASGIGCGYVYRWMLVVDPTTLRPAESPLNTLFTEKIDPAMAFLVHEGKTYAHARSLEQKPYVSNRGLYSIENGALTTWCTFKSRPSFGTTPLYPLE